MYPQGVCRIRKPAYAGNGCAIPAGGYAASVSQLALATAALYFKFFKLQDWDKRSAAVRRRNYAVLP